MSRKNRIIRVLHGAKKLNLACVSTREVADVLRDLGHPEDTDVKNNVVGSQLAILRGRRRRSGRPYKHAGLVTRYEHQTGFITTPQGQFATKDRYWSLTENGVREALSLENAA